MIGEQSHGEPQRWGPVNRADRPQQSVERRIRVAVSKRSPEEQAAHRARYSGDAGVDDVSDDDHWEELRKELLKEGTRFNAQGKITPEDRQRLLRLQWSDAQIGHMEKIQKKFLEKSEAVGATKIETVVDAELPQDVLEESRKQLSDAGYFDESGKISPEKHASLYIAGWSHKLLDQMEKLQGNYIGKVTVVPADSGPAFAKQGEARNPNAARMLREAQQRAEEASRERDQRERELRLERSRTGIMAFHTALNTGMSETDAERARQAALDAFDRDQQQKRNLRSAA